ncbi:hypothetical protein [Allobranchiibius sp. CTAmp26]|uniref:hypothetical protein n=1 Tax=Allobranchiibius sp. CTAmp26 TaxID=2815214 RepID=UPI001AA113B6|nr:hypothetical protein [Allobranchiibius sp. CTAmp26]MBO1756860.1 hypothetical protein [Allobranchiibius sp. CTAmp26]
MSAGKKTGPITARAKARERKAMLDAHRAQRDQRIEKHATSWYEQQDAIAIANAAIEAARERQVQAVGALLDAEDMSIEDAAALLDVDTSQVRTLRKHYRATQEAAPGAANSSGEDEDVLQPRTAVA